MNVKGENTVFLFLKTLIHSLQSEAECLVYLPVAESDFVSAGMASHRVYISGLTVVRSVVMFKRGRWSRD